MAETSFRRGQGGASLDRRYALAKNAVWTPFPFAASCSNLGTIYQTCGYWKDPFGLVHLRGMLQFAGVPAAGQLIGTLPVGYRPSGYEDFPAIGTYAAGILAFPLEIATVGSLNVYNASGVAWTGTSLSLSGISFDGNG